jgi:tetratricopeptide (TPR) repeat protein
MISAQDVQEMMTLAKEHFVAGNYKASEPILTQLLLHNSRSPEIYQMLATIFYERGQFNKAIKTFKRALEIDPAYTDASVGLSIILNDLGRYDEGKKIFEDAQLMLDRKSGKSDPYVDEKLASKHEEIADLYFQYKRFTESLEQLFKAQKLSTRKPEITMRIAECFIAINQPEKAIRDLKHLIKDYPQFIPARLKLGVIYYNGNMVSLAVEQWEQILARDPGHREALKYLKVARKNAGATTTFDLT